MAAQQVVEGIVEDKEAVGDDVEKMDDDRREKAVLDARASKGAKKGRVRWFAIF